MTMRRLGLVATCAIGLLLSPAAGLAAGATTITIDVNNVTGVESFTATGGILCPSGTATTDFHHFGGGGAAGSFHLTKTLDCDDGSGTFTIRVNAATVLGSPTDQGGWSVAGGTGDYEGLAGGGNLVGTYVPTGIIDLYTGFVRN
jgi:hypothetical protein